MLSKDKIKNKIVFFIRKHLRIYTLLILLLGVIIGGHFEGQDEDGTYYYNLRGLTFYGGIINGK